MGHIDGASVVGVSLPLPTDSETSWRAAWGFLSGSEPFLIRVEVASHKPATPWSGREVRLQRSVPPGFKAYLTVLGRINYRVLSTAPLLLS